MSFTTLANLWDPEIIANAVVERFNSVSRLVKSGMVAPMASIRAKLNEGAGTVISMPSFNPNNDDSTIPGTSDITTSNIPANMQKVLVNHRAKAWGQYDLAAKISCSDPIGAVAGIIGDFWAGQAQKIVISSMTGLFLNNVEDDAGDLVNDISAGTGAAGQISVSALIDTFSKLGDSQGDVVGIAMHSDVFATYAKLQGALASNDSEVIKGLIFDKSLGKYILIDDTCAKDASDNYSTYVFKAGAVVLDQGVENVLSKLDVTNGGFGSTTLISRYHGVAHVNGFSFVGNPSGESATFVEMATEGNWDRVVDRKKTGVAVLISKA